MIQSLLELNGGTQSSDEALMEQIKRRQQWALKALFDRHSTTLKGVIVNIVRDEAEMDDVLQDTLIQLWREAAEYSALAGKPLGWLITLTRRRAIDRLRRKQAYSRAKSRFEEEIKRRPNDVKATHVETEVCQSDLRRFLERQMQNLPAFQRQAVQLSFFGGLSHREISAQTGVPLGTVKTRLELGLRKLTAAIRPLNCTV